jgi:aminomethyltransferase
VVCNNKEGFVAHLLETPLSAWHKAQGAKMAPFAGWDMPIQYEGILLEHTHTRTAASVFDICHMGEFLLSGTGAAAALARAVSHNLDTLALGKCRYGFLLNDEGNVLDDLIVYRKGDDDFMLVVNGACEASDFATLAARMPAGVQLHNVSAQTAKIDLQGPLSLAVLESLLQENFHTLPYFAFRTTSFEGENLLVSRTGYTGELGYELYLPWGKALALWQALLADARVKPAGLGARDTLRLEAGLPLYGHELDTAHNPTEAGMGKMLSSKASYVGKEGASTVRQVLLPLKLEGRRAARNGDSLALPDGSAVGTITSGSFAPTLGYGIAFAWVDAAYADQKEFVVQTARAGLPATVTSLPFYSAGTARMALV